MKKKLFLAITISLLTLLKGSPDYIIDPRPLCSIYTKNSILEHPEQYKPLYIGNRLRYGTCSSIAWFDNTYLATLNVLGGKVSIYSFDSNNLHFNLLQEIAGSDARLVYPIGLTFSSDGTLLAIGSDSPYFGVTLYKVNLNKHHIDPKPFHILKTKYLVHNVKFTHNNAYLITAGFNENESLCVYKVKQTSSPFLCVCKKQAPTPFARAKAILLTQDNRFIVAVYSTSPKKEGHDLGTTLLKVYTFNAKKGIIGDQVCSLEDKSGIGCVEDMAFLPQDSALILSDNAKDMLIIYPFDPAIGKIGETYELIKNPEAQLSFPHGITVSPDNNFLAVTNYGDDKFSLYTIIHNPS